MFMHVYKLKINLKNEKTILFFLWTLEKYVVKKKYVKYEKN